MKLNDWEILQCVQRKGKSTIGERDKGGKNRSVDIVPMDPARASAQRWKKVLLRKTEKGH